MATDPILITVETNGIATVMLNRPAKRNCVSLAMWRSLGDIFGDLGGRREVRTIILTGSGDHFCAGADISEFSSVRRDAEAAHDYEVATEGAALAIFHCPKPTIAQISGYCVGGGCGLALACDFRVADASARIGIPAARLGIVYGLLDCQLLTAVAGFPNARRILYSGELFPAEEARAMGLIDVLEPKAAATGAHRLAERLAANAPLSIRGSKLIINALVRGEAGERQADIKDIMSRAADSADYREGARAFLEKRSPNFRGA